MRKSTLFAVVVAGVVAVALLRGGGAKRRSAERDWPVGFAHRGASARAPENTMEAFRLAAESGVRALETDVHMTRDGYVVAIHDDSVDRTTDGAGLVRGMTFAELKGLDAGYRFTPDGGETYPYRGKGVRVPGIREVFREFEEFVVNIEIKEEQPGVEEALLGAIKEHGAEDRVIVASGRARPVRRFRRLSRGRVRTAASALDIAVFYYLSRMRLERLLRPPYDALQVPVEYRGTPLVTPRFLKAAHGRGLRVDVWTIDNPGEMRRLLDLGADAIMTNRPEVLEEVLRGNSSEHRGMSGRSEPGASG